MSIFVPIPFSFVDQSSPRRLENFDEDIPTSPKVIEAHTLNFKSNFKFSGLIFTVRRSLHGICYSNSVRPSDRPSVRLSVCLSHSWTVSTWFDLRS